MLNRELTLEEIRWLQQKVKYFWSDSYNGWTWLKIDWKIVLPPFYSFWNKPWNEPQSMIYWKNFWKTRDERVYVWVDLITWKIIDQIVFYSSVILKKDTWEIIDREFFNKTNWKVILSQKELENKIWEKIKDLYDDPSYYQWNIIFTYKKIKNKTDKQYYIIYNVYENKFISEEYTSILFYWWYYICINWKQYDILNVDWKKIFSTNENDKKEFCFRIKENLLLIWIKINNDFQVIKIIEVDWKKNTYKEHDVEKYVKRDQCIANIYTWEDWEQLISVLDTKKEKVTIYNLKWWKVELEIDNKKKVNENKKDEKIWNYSFKINFNKDWTKKNISLLDKNWKVLITYDEIKFSKTLNKQDESKWYYLCSSNDNQNMSLYDDNLKLLFEYDEKKDNFNFFKNLLPCILTFVWDKIYFITWDYQWWFKIIDEKKNIFKDNISQYSYYEWILYLITKDNLIEPEQYDLKTMKKIN